MVKTRNQYHTSHSPPLQTQNSPEFTELKTQRKAKSILKEEKITISALRKNILCRLSKNKQKKSKVIDFNRQSVFSIIISQKLNCPICLQFIMQPALTPCGHIFCLHCIEQSLKHKSACSLCRQRVHLDDPISSKFLKNIAIQVSSRIFTQQESDQYRKRIDLFNAKQTQRKIHPSILEGDLVDFFIDNTWIEGKVMEIETNSNEKILKIQALQNANKMGEFGLGSRLIAKHRSFTKPAPTLNRDSSIFLIEFEDEIFNSISNSVFFFLESPINNINWFQMEAI